MKYTAVAIIYNPNSTGSSEDSAKAFAKRLRKQLPNQPIDLIGTEYPGHADEIAYTLSVASKHPLIISSSGDGGYHEVINGIMKARHEGYDPTAGLLPAGNANDHYRNLHDKDILEDIEKGRRHEIDVLKLTGKVDGKRFVRYGHSYIGFGLTPFVARELNKTKLNFFNQIWIVTKALLNLRTVRLIIDKKARRYDSIIFSNVDSMSKVLKVSQPSRINDGKFEVTIFRRRNKLKLISQLLKASTVGVTEDARVKKFSLKTVRRTLVQIDGEITALDADSTVTVTIEHQALPCIV